MVFFFQGKGFVLLLVGVGESRERERERERNNTEHVLTKMMLRLDFWVIFVFRRVGDW